MIRLARILVAASLVLILPGCLGGTLTSEDTTAVYSLVIRDRVETRLPDIEGSQVYLVGWTLDETGLRAGDAFEGSAEIPEPVRQGICDTLDDLPCEFVWVDSYRDVPWDSAPGGRIAVVGVGRVEREGQGVDVWCNFHIEDSSSHDSRIDVYSLEKLESDWAISQVELEMQCL